MIKLQRLRKLLALPIISVFLLCTLPVAAVNAKMIGTDKILDQNRISTDRARVIEFVERDDVQQQMESLGVDPDEAKRRVATLSDSEIEHIAGNLDEMPAGEGAIGAIVGAAVLVFLVLLITDLLCLTNVFNFTKACAR